ncbi:hypothetical protein SASPL_105188 [Salvia splendens]|uniref:Transmembrane protein 45B n=1 Tax=Salvia splendens TaxID=180675 RepID=A0A8X9ABD2_SALSN|nr:uncharacterized protein LOC121776727 [Salvia splendens]KAG6433574.1 hypothetical protein SASPL_105188 [Salvia splendens]
MQGGTSGHVSLGFAFLIIGTWHLFNSIKHHSLQPKTFISLPWFPAPRLKYLEPLTIILVTTVFIISELFLAGTGSPTAANNLRHLEHSLIALSFSIYASFAVLLDRLSPPPPAHRSLLHLLQAAAFAQQLLILHLHSTDHAGVEGQYHWLMQLVTSAALLATLLLAANPRSFLASFARGFSVVFQGVWLVVMGFMLWTPEWMPEGCFLKGGAVLCRGDRALHRAKALVNLLFGLYLIVLTVFVMVFYLVLIKMYPRQKDEYRSLMVKFDEEEEGD